MKKTVFIGLIFIASATAAHAQTDNRSIETRDIKLALAGDSVRVMFTLDAGKKVTKSRHLLIINPLILNGENSIHLPPLMVRGKRNRALSACSELAALQAASGQKPVYMKAGESAKYSATIPYARWMSGARLVLDGLSVGCGLSEDTNIGLIADNILYLEPSVREPVAEAPVVARQSVGDRLSALYDFVVPVAEIEGKKNKLFDYNMPLNLGRGVTTTGQNEVERFVNETRQGSLSIAFRQGSSVLDRDFRANNKNLVDLISAARAIAASGDCRIVRIVIAGFASPEGSLQHNNQLAWERATALKQFITTNSSVDAGVIHSYNGSIDWVGLRQLVDRSDMRRKYRIMDIIDTMPIWDARNNVGRHGELMRLDNGAPYHYMLREFFPELRQATYVKIYYENEPG